MDNQNFDRDIGYLFDLTDTDSSSSSSNGVFESMQPYILELHEIKKDTEKPNNIIEVKPKRHRKKKGQVTANRSHSSESSNSVSDVNTLMPVRIDEGVKEEFYDAHDSYHTMPENQEIRENPMATAGLMLAHSKQDENPKINQGQNQDQENQGSTALRGSSTITKPSTQPE